MSTYEVSILGTMAGQAVVNSFGVQWGNAADLPSAAEAATVAEFSFSKWKAAFLVRLSDQYAVQSAVARGMEDGRVSGVSTGGAQAGSLTGAALPTFCVAKIRLATNEPGRSGKGRTGLSGLVETYTDPVAPNELNGGALVDLRPQVTAWFDSMKTGSPASSLAVISRVFRKIERPTPVAFAVTGVSLDARLGTRVSRLR